MVIVDVAFQDVDTQIVIQTISPQTVTGRGSLCNTKTCLGSSQCCVTPVIRRYGLSRISTLPSNWPKIQQHGHTSDLRKDATYPTRERPHEGLQCRGSVQPIGFVLLRGLVPGVHRSMNGSGQALWSSTTPQRRLHHVILQDVVSDLT